jgi:N-acetylglucosamine-6-phosphate deacetylase
MASLTPATVVGIGHRIGSLESGKLADIVVFEDDMTPWRTMVAGRWTNQSNSDVVAS